MIDDSTDRQIREHSTVGARKPGCRTTGGENPVALSSSDRVNSNQLLALVVPENPQVHVIQPRQAVRTNQCPHHLHDLHQVGSPVLVEGDGLEVAGAVGAAEDGLGGSGSQWSMIPTIVRSLG